jgi:hypothetical protein
VGGPTRGFKLPMITRSPPPRRVQTASQRPSLTAGPGGGSSSTSNSNSNSLSNGTHTAPSDHHHPLRNSITATSSLAASLSNNPTPSRRPEDAQNDYWLKQMAAVITERDKAKAQATASEEARTTHIYELRQQFADERHQWKQTCDVVSKQTVQFLILVMSVAVPSDPLFFSLSFAATGHQPIHIASTKSTIG